MASFSIRNTFRQNFENAGKELAFHLHNSTREKSTSCVCSIQTLTSSAVQSSVDLWRLFEHSLGAAARLQPWPLPKPSQVIRNFVAADLCLTCYNRGSSPLTGQSIPCSSSLSELSRNRPFFQLVSIRGFLSTCFTGEVAVRHAAKYHCISLHGTSHFFQSVSFHLLNVQPVLDSLLGQLRSNLLHQGLIFPILADHDIVRLSSTVAFASHSCLPFFS